MAVFMTSVIALIMSPVASVIRSVIMSAQRSVAGVLLIDVRSTPVLIIVAVKVPIGGDSLLMFCGQPVLPNGLGARFFIVLLFM